MTAEKEGQELVLKWMFVACELLIPNGHHDPAMKAKGGSGKQLVSLCCQRFLGSLRNGRSVLLAGREGKSLATHVALL